MTGVWLIFYHSHRNIQQIFPGFKYSIYCFIALYDAKGVEFLSNILIVKRITPFQIKVNMQIILFLENRISSFWKINTTVLAKIQKS